MLSQKIIFFHKIIEKSAKLIRKLNEKFLEKNSMNTDDESEGDNKKHKIKNKFKNLHHHVAPTSAAVKQFNPYQVDHRYYQTELKNKEVII